MRKLSTFNQLIRDALWTPKVFRYKVEIIADNPNPDLLKDDIVYVVGKDPYVKWAYLKCPSKCGDIIMLSLIKANRPSWVIKQDKIGRPTISPSIRKLDGCKSHFWIKKGKLIWV
jgi:hypothetical protein